VICAQHAKQLADDLRERVKALGFERHKLIIQVGKYFFANAYVLLAM
jgi:hypothetical protein